MKHFAINPRQITKKQLDRLAKDLAELGDLGGLVHDLNSDEVIGGNQRGRVFDLSKIKPVITETFDAPNAQGTVARGYIEWKGERFAYRQVRWTPEQCKAANIAANLDGGSWDWDILPSWDNLIGYGFDADLLTDWKRNTAALGNLIESEAPEPADAEPQIDRAAELLEKWQVKTGDLWRIGEHRLLCGDSTKREDVERVMQGERIDATVTDPPYGVGVDYGSFEDTPEKVKELIKNIMPIILDNLPASLTPGVPAMWDYPRPSWVGAWVHPASTSSGAWGFVGSNPILYYGKDPYLSAGKGRRDSSLVMSTTRKGENEHPVSKPLSVWEWLIERMTPERGQIVFDTFCGSGTTLVACENLGRKCRAIEISPAYCAVTLERMATAFPGISIERVGSNVPA